MTDAFRPLLETSQNEKKGLTFYIHGQTIAGTVTALHDYDSVVEVANRSQSRILIRLDRVDAIGLG